MMRTLRIRGSVLGTLLVMVLLATVLTAAPAAGARQEDLTRVSAPPTTGQRLYDAIVLRAFRVVHVVAGAVALVPAYPLSMLIGAEDAVVQACIDDPVERAFRAPLGSL